MGQWPSDQVGGGPQGPYASKNWGLILNSEFAAIQGLSRLSTPASSLRSLGLTARPAVAKEASLFSTNINIKVDIPRKIFYILLTLPHLFRGKRARFDIVNMTRRRLARRALQKPTAIGLAAE